MPHHLGEATHRGHFQPLLGAVGSLDGWADRHGGQPWQVRGDLFGLETSVHRGHVRFSSINLDMGAADDLEQLAVIVRLPGGVSGGDVGPTAGEPGEAGIPSM